MLEIMVKRRFLLHVSMFLDFMEDVLKPPGSLLATDRSKAVVLV